MSASTVAGVAPLLERERVGERLQRGSGLPRDERPVDRAAVLGVGVVARSLPRQPLAARVVEHDDRDVRGAVRAQRFPLVLDDALDLALQIQVERRLDPRVAVAFRRRPATISTKCGALNGDASAVERHLLGARFAQPLGAQAPAAAMRRSTGLLPRRRGGDVLRSGLNAVGRCGSAARNAACAGVSIDGVDAEVQLARAPGAGGLVAVRRQVQIQREDLALGEAMLEPEREHHLADLRAPARAACTPSRR